MQRTPPIDNNPPSKRKLQELSPESAENKCGNMDINDLVKLIKDTINTNLDERLKDLSTKSDLDDVKSEISSEVNALRMENKHLKEEMAKMKKENEENKKDIKWLENQVKTNKLFIKGLYSAKEPFTEVRNFFKDKLQIEPNIQAVRKIFDKNEKMSVVVEFESSQSVEEVLKNTRKLAGSSISVERDLIPRKQQDKKAFLILKKRILAVSKEHKVLVRDDKLKIKDKWFKWNNANELVTGNSDGENVLITIYGEVIKSISCKYDDIMQNLNQKN